MQVTPTRLATSLTLTLMLAACGGGDGDGGGAGTSDPSFTASCSGDFCGAASNTRYSGSGVGIWSYTNSGRSSTTLPLQLSNLDNRNVTLVYTNQTADAVALPRISLNAAQRQANFSIQTAEATESGNQIPSQVRDFNAGSHLQAINADANTPSQALRAIQTYSEGQSRSWIISDVNNSLSSRTAVLRRQVTANDGRTINIWVEDGEYGDSKLTEADVTRIAERFASNTNSVYSMVTGIAGQPWGQHRYGSDLISADQALDIVFVNFDRNGRPYGLLGYFWSLNNFQHDANDSDLRNSNASLSFYMDTETVYLARSNDEGMTTQIATLAHEFTHMINFYQRSVVMEGNGTYAFDTFLEEMTAMMMEDVVGLQLDASNNSARDNYFPLWLNAPGYNCDLTDWIADTSSPCFSYPVNGSFGAYLMRQYGLSFYGNLLRDASSTDSPTILSNVISKAGGDGLGNALRKWGTSIALLPSAASPQGYGYPERIDSNYTLPGINGSDYQNVRQLPSSVPTNLQAYGHFPFTRTPVNGSLNESFTIPAGTSLTVIVQ